MEIVPVIDLKGGAVVRALQGDRANYRPIRTPLSRTSEPADVARPATSGSSGMVTCPLRTVRHNDARSCVPSSQTPP